MEWRKCFALGEQNLLVDSSVTSAKYGSIGCGNITVLFYWQLDSKLAGMYEYKPPIMGPWCFNAICQQFAPYATTCVPLEKKMI